MGSFRMRSGLALALAGTMALAGASVAVAQDETEVAYLSASSANTWLGTSRVEMEKVAAENGIKLIEFDAQFDANRQSTQLQDVIAADRYAGIIVAALDGAGLIPDLQKASEAGMKIVALNQIVGDQLDTADPQDASVSASVLAPPLRSGERLGAVTLMACADLDPCNVVYFYGIKGIPLDNALKLGFDAVTADSAVYIVAEGEGQYLGPDVGLAAMQDILVGTSDIDVVVGADQSMQGVEIALEDAGMLGEVGIIGLGGSTPALAAIADGRWFGGVMGAPGTEGRLAMEAMVAALAGEDLGGFDPLLELPDMGLVTADNVSSFTAEWDG
jgi:ribose transport system substrate-binding protein